MLRRFFATLACAAYFLCMAALGELGAAMTGPQTGATFDAAIGNTLPRSLMPAYQPDPCPPVDGTYACDNPATAPPQAQ